MCCWLCFRVVFPQGGSSEEGSCAALPPRRGRPAGGGGGRVTRHQLPEELAVKVNTPPANSDRAPDAALKVRPTVFMALRSAFDYEPLTVGVCRRSEHGRYTIRSNACLRPSPDLPVYPFVRATLIGRLVCQLFSWSSMNRLSHRVCYKRCLLRRSTRAWIYDHPLSGGYGNEVCGCP